MEPIVTLTPEVADDPLAALASPPEGASVVEIRADLLPDLDLRTAVAACPLPVLITYRSETEGGSGAVDPETRAAILASARDSGAALIDVEFARDREAAQRLGIAPEQMVMSWHDPAGTPHDLLELATAMAASSAGHLKIVPTANRLADVEAVLSLFPAAGRNRRRIIAFAMGVVGMPTRIIGPLLGSPITFAAWRENAAAAPGQMPLARMTAIAGHLEAPPQRLFGIVGRDVTSSLSPVMHAAGFRELDLPYLFIPVSVPDIEELPLLFAPAGETLFDRVGLPASGWAVTTPYKDAAAAAATLRAPRVERCGSSNTLVLRASMLAADTTDADGVVSSLMAAGVDPEGRAAVVQGTGGAGRAAAVGLHLAGAEAAIRGRDDGHTAKVAGAIGVKPARSCGPVPEDAILVNATPLGSDPDGESPFPADEVARAAAVVDMVYADQPTPLELVAQDAGVTFVDGRGMLAHQGFAQFAAFTTRLPPKAAMLAAVQRTR